MSNELDRLRQRLDGDRRPLHNGPEVGATYSVGKGSPVTTIKGGNGRRTQIAGRLTLPFIGILTQVHSGQYGLEAQKQSAIDQNGNPPHVILKGDLVWAQSEHMQKTS